LAGVNPRPVVLVVEHEAACPPAHLGSWLERAGCRLELCRPYAGDALPSSLAGYDGLLVLGGSMGAYDVAQHPWLGPLRDLVLGARVPVLGICLGHQLVAVAHGGEVRPNPRGQQLGLLDVGWTPEAAGDPLTGGLATARRGLQWNHDLVTKLPSDAVLLAATAAGEPQVVRFAPTTWGVQLHPEADEKVAAVWAEGDRDEHRARGIDQAKLLRELAEARAELDRVWSPLGERFAALVADR
jgi:GMP synthase (glutamine-hydrolysing)